jgi:hypothetical protein
MTAPGKQPKVNLHLLYREAQTQKSIGRKEVEEAMINHHLKEIKEEMEPLSKLEEIKKTDARKMQDYMSQKSLENSRIEFLWETNMLETR